MEETGKTEVAVTPTLADELLLKAHMQREELIQQTASLLGGFHAPEDKRGTIHTTIRMSQHGFVRMTQLQTTLRKNGDTNTTQGDVLDLGLQLIEKALVRMGIEIEPITEKQVKDYQEKSKAIKEAAQKRKEKREAELEKERKAAEEKLKTSTEVKSTTKGPLMDRIKEIA